MEPAHDFTAREAHVPILSAKNYCFSSTVALAAVLVQLMVMVCLLADKMARELHLVSWRVKRNARRY